VGQLCRLARFENGNILPWRFHHGVREGLGVINVNAKVVSDHNNILSDDAPAITPAEFPARPSEWPWGVAHEVAAPDIPAHLSTTSRSPIYHRRTAAARYLLRGAIALQESLTKMGYIYYGEFMYVFVGEGIGMLEIHEIGTSDEPSIRTPATGVYVGKFSGDRLNGRE